MVNGWESKILLADSVDTENRSPKHCFLNQCEPQSTFRDRPILQRLRSEAPCVKIGISNDINQRIEDIESQCCIITLEECDDTDKINVPGLLAENIGKVCYTKLTEIQRGYVVHM